MKLTKKEKINLTNAVATAISLGSSSEILVKYTGASAQILNWMDLLVKINPRQKPWVEDVKKRYDVNTNR